MDLTYKVRGADGKEYGPATPAQISGWLSEGRLSLQTEVTRSDINYWAPIASFTEFQSAQSAAPPPIAPVTVAGVDPAVEALMKSGASWFYWIAALSLINSFLAISGKELGFALGLGITQIFDAVGNEIGPAGKIVALVLGLLAAGVFVLFGVFAHKRHAWAFITGMILYALDGLIYLIALNWIGIAIHVFALVCIFRGFNACRELKAGAP